MALWLAMPKPSVSKCKLAIGLELGISEFYSCIENNSVSINSIFIRLIPFNFGIS
jgi:hypothetical protein